MAKEKKVEAPSPDELTKLLAQKDAERAKETPTGKFKKGKDLGGGLVTVDRSDPIVSNKLR